MSLTRQVTVQIAVGEEQSMNVEYTKEVKQWEIFWDDWGKGSLKVQERVRGSVEITDLAGDI
jgi:hypothetical protein